MDTVELSIAERMLFLCVSSDNILVLDIFFEALNYETIEQKKAYELAGLLGKGAQVRPRRLVNNSSAIVMDLLFSYFKEILWHIFKLTLMRVNTISIRGHGNPAVKFYKVFFFLLVFTLYVCQVYDAHFTHYTGLCLPMLSDLQVSDLLSTTFPTSGGQMHGPILLHSQQACDVTAPFWFVFPGDIGGQMGLFIGASILTILELFDYLYEVRVSLSLSLSLSTSCPR